MQRLVALLFVVGLGNPVFASQPGQPLDCSDFVIDEPGITCRKIVDCGRPIGGSDPVFPCAMEFPGEAHTMVFAIPDSAGQLLGADSPQVQVSCNGYIGGYSAVRIKGFDSSSERLIAHASSRCAEVSDTPIVDELLLRNVMFDAIGGRLVVVLISQGNGGTAIYTPHLWMAAFEGFTTLFDVLDSYVPTSNAFVLRMPQRPEGLRAADRFDTYWGSVTRPPDLSQAHPLQCAYPDHQPQVGEYLTYPDAAPTPLPGQAVYYLTSVTYQGQTRAGRQALDGRLSGRNASHLPACVIAKEAKR